jgi:hypothetical protein
VAANEEALVAAGIIFLDAGDSTRGGRGVRLRG